MFAALLGCAVAAARPALALQLSAGTATAAAGDTVEIVMTVGSTDGLGVMSFEFDLGYSSNLVSATDVIEDGTLVAGAGWGEAAFHITSSSGVGRIHVGSAGTTALVGAGDLVRIQFVINPAQKTATSAFLTLSNLTFNEGTPTGTTANGAVTILATPGISVSPNSGEVVRGQSLQFTVAGSVTNPVTWSTTDAGVASISSVGLLTGVSPGSVRVVAVDDAGQRDTTTGVVNIRGMGVTAGSTTTQEGLSFSVPVMVTDLSGLGIRAGQFTLTFSGTLLTATGVTTPMGTLLDGWGPVQFGAANGSCTVGFAGNTDLGGSGTLCFVQFTAGSSPGSTNLVVAQALFNETLPAKPTGGIVSVQPTPGITVGPENVTLLSGQTRQFTLSGGPSMPVTWSVLSSAVASIDGSGLLTALAGGTTQVRAVDAIGVEDLNTLVTVYDLHVSADTVTVAPGSVVLLGIESDRDLGSLDVHSLEYTLQWSSPYLTGVAFDDFGLVGAWAPNVLGDNATSGQLAIAAAGSTPLASTGRLLHRVRFDVSLGAPDGANIPITLSRLLCNEGSPSAQLGNGLIRVRTVTGVTPGGWPRTLAFAPPAPNPATGSTRFSIAVPFAAAGAEPRVRLVIHGVEGRRVRTLLDGVVSAGEHELAWDLRDDAGRAVPPGIYWARLERDGASVARRLAVIR